MTQSAIAILAVTIGMFAITAHERLARGIWAIPNDGLSGLILGVTVGEDTVYSTGYSEWSFRKVTLGMSRSEVEALIGPPQKEWALDEQPGHSGVGARWSYSPSDTHFRCRVLLFRDGVLAEKHAGFYFD